MTDGVVLGERVGPFEARIDKEFLQRYADATSDASSSARAGQSVPPTALVTQIWEAQDAARPVLVPDELQRSATGGVHGEHDIVIHRPIVPGERLHTWVDGHGARPAGRNCLVTLRYSTLDADDDLVAEQWWTTVYLGTSCEPTGEPAPEHAFADEARTRPLGTFTKHIDEQMATRYAGVSSDWSPHHFEIDAARRSGVDRVFLHGLCTMALCAQAVTDFVADGDASRVRRIAVRFASPTFLGEELTVGLYDAGPSTVAFEARCAGAMVVTHGRAELR
jgi:acyl dehydratase